MAPAVRLWWTLLLMATTIVSNLATYSDATGHGNQSHLVYAATQQRWWLFVFKTKTATVVSTYVSSSNDLTTATWSASTDSPAFSSSRAMTAEQRNLGVVGFANGSTDVAHVSVALNATGRNSYTEHIRATFTGASSITWESWGETAAAGNTGSFTGPVMGNTLSVGTDGKVHGCSCNAQGTLTNQGVGGDPDPRLSTNADTGATWTTGFGNTVATDDSMAFQDNSFALAKLASAAMLLVFENASVSDANSGGLRYQTYASGTTWPNNTGAADAGAGATTQDENDWCLCAVDTTHVYAFRRSGASTFVWRKYDGSVWTTPANGVPTQNHKAASGLFAATDGTDLWLFVLDSAANNPVQYVKCTGASAATPTWGAWTQLEAAGSTARNYIAGCPVVANQQVGVIYTAVNGTNFDVVLSALGVAAAAAAYVPYDVPHSPQHQALMAM